MNSKALFGMALGLETLWEVTEITFSKNEAEQSELHLHIGFASGSRFLDETKELCCVHDTVERQWQHLCFFEYTCYLTWSSKTGHTS